MIKEALKSGINRILDDCSTKKITRESLRIYGENDWETINKALAEWESRGLLKILKASETADDSDICIEMLHYIDHPDYENWPQEKE